MNGLTANTSGIAKMDDYYSVLMHYRDWEFHFATDLKRNEQFEKHVDADGIIRLLYKYNPYYEMQTEIIFMLPDDNGKLKRTLVKHYGCMSPFARWWHNLVNKTEKEHEYKMANII